MRGKRKLWYRIKLSFSYKLYQLFNLILGLFDYGYYHARYVWKGRVLKVPFAGENMDISEDTVAILCRRDGRWGRGVALRLASCDTNGFVVKCKLFGGRDFVRYWDFGNFTFDRGG